MNNTIVLEGLIPEPKVRLVIYQKLLELIKENKITRHQLPFMCNRIAYDILPEVFESDPMYIQRMEDAIESNYDSISIIFPEIVRNDKCSTTNGTAWGECYDYDLRIGIVEESINRVNKLI